MNNEYYGIATTPTDDYLAHYGVKGMKWGVRRAIEKGNTKALDRHYREAAKKLEKLSKRTDIEAQNNIANKYNKVAKVSGRIGLAAAGTLAGLHLGKDINGVLFRAYSRKAADASNEYYKALQGDSLSSTTELHNLRKYYNNAAEKASKRYSFADDALDPVYGRSRSYIGTAARHLAVGGLGVAAGAKIKAHVAKKRTTAAGHAKAVADRDAWKNQMAEVFKGTKYAKLPAVQKKKRG